MRRKKAAPSDPRDITFTDWKRAIQDIEYRRKVTLRSDIFVIEKRPHNRRWMKWDYDDHFPPNTGIVTVLATVLKYPVMGCKVDIRLRKGDTVYYEFRPDDVDD